MVEDNFSDVEILALFVEGYGYEVTICGPQDAIQWNKEHLPKVVQLNGLDGMCFGLIEDLRKDNPGAHYLLYSARREFFKQAAKRGIKPFDKDSSETLLKYVAQLQQK